METEITKPVVSVTFSSLTLPRIIPSHVCISWKCNKEVGKTDTFPTNSLVIPVKQGFEAVKMKDEHLQYTVAVHAVNKDGHSIKFSEEKITIPEDVYTRKDVYRHVEIKSSIGNFMIEIKYSLQQKSFPQENVDPEAKIKEYKEVIDKFTPLSNEELSPDTYLKVSNLIREIGQIPVSKFTPEQLKEIDDIYNELVLKHKQINARYDLNVHAIMALMEKQFLYVTESGDVKNYSFFHNSTDQRFPLISVILCRSLTKFFDEDLHLSLDTIDQFMIDVCYLFANIVASKEMSDRSFLYLISAVCTIYKYQSKYINRDFQSFTQVLFMTYKRTLSQALEVDIEHVQKMDVKQFLSWYRDHSTLCFDLCVPPEAISLIHSYICDFFDAMLVRQWLKLENPPEPNFNDLIKGIPVQWPFVRGLMFIYQNAEKIVKQKINKTEIPEECRGSVLQNVLKKMIAMKKIKANEKQLLALKEKDKPAQLSILEYVEINAKILTDNVNIQKDLPEPKY